MKILVANATAPRNIGDLAMLDVLLEILRKLLPTAEITVHSYEPKLHKDKRVNAYNLKNADFHKLIFRMFSMLFTSPDC